MVNVRVVAVPHQPLTEPLLCAMHARPLPRRFAARAAFKKHLQDAHVKARAPEGESPVDRRVREERALLAKRLLARLKKGSTTVDTQDPETAVVCSACAATPQLVCVHCREPTWPVGWRPNVEAGLILRTP